MNRRDFFNENGYCTFEGLIPESKIDRLLETLEGFKRLGLPYYAQSIHRWIRPELDESGFMVESMENFTQLQLSCGLAKSGNAILLSSEIESAMRELKPRFSKFVNWQNMLFDKSTGTIDHQDSWYLDTYPKGDLIAAWVALEDIEVNAGPFHVYPKSHRSIDAYAMQDLEHEAFKQKCVALSANFERHSALLKKGSVLFWHPWLLHGSAAQRESGYSRKSLTAHYFPLGVTQQNGVGTAAGSEYSAEEIARDLKSFRQVERHPVLVARRRRREISWYCRGVGSFLSRTIRSQTDVHMDMRGRSYSSQTNETTVP